MPIDIRRTTVEWMNEKKKNDTNQTELEWDVDWVDAEIIGDLLPE